MRKGVIGYILVTISWLAVLYPVWTRARGMTFSFGQGLWFDVFPFFGIIAFCVMWLHVVGGALRPWLERYINFDKFVDGTSILVFISLVLHPLFLVIGAGRGAGNIFSAGGVYIWLGVAGLFLLLTYDIGKALKKREFFTRHWDAILILSTLGFVLIFFHSLGLGSDVRAGTLRSVWMFYGVTGIAAAVYNYGIRRLLRRP